MARKRQPRRREKLIVWPVFVTLTLSTLSDNAVIDTTLLDLAHDARLVSADLTIAAKGQTVGQAPIYIGMSHSDLSITEISEAVAAAPASPDDIIQNERARRPVRDMGVLSAVSIDEVLNNGMPARFRIGLSIRTAFDLNLWAQNRSGAPLTSGTIVTVAGKIFGHWR